MTDIHETLKKAVPHVIGFHENSKEVLIDLLPNTPATMRSKIAEIMRSYGYVQAWAGRILQIYRKV